jgi:hypothetical protein
MTTAIILVIIGSLLEYSPNTEYYILAVGLIVSLIRIANGLMLLISNQNILTYAFDIANK